MWSWRTPLLVVLSAPLLCAAQGTRAGGQATPTEAPCTAIHSALHGDVLIGVRTEAVGGPPCAVLREYADWLQRSDALLDRPASRTARLSGREWDFASGALRFGAPRDFVLFRGDSLRRGPAGFPSTLHLTAFAAGADEPPRELGTWYVLVDEDSTSRHLFRSPLTARRPHAVLEDGGSVVYTTAGVSIDAAHVRRQLAEARALRRALGFTGPLPAARFVIGDPRDTTLTMLGVRRMARPLYAMMVAPPLAVFAPLSTARGLDAHELTHVATVGRRDAVPPSVGEGFAMHHGGSHGRPFDAAVCASARLRALPDLGAAELDSALSGAWWDDPRADVAGFALGHAVRWFIAQRGDSAWLFAEDATPPEPDALTFLARRAGIPRDSAMAALVAGFAARRAACAAPPARPAPVTPPSAAAGAPGRASR